MGTKRKPIENLVQIPSEGAGPIWMDTVGNGYPEVRDAFMELLRLTFPVVVNMAHKLPPAQRGVTAVKIVPDTKEFYPIGIMAPYVQMTPEQQKAVNILYEEIGKAIRKASDAGNWNGRNL